MKYWIQSNMKKHQLEELVRHIHRRMMKEFVSFQDKKAMAAQASNPTSQVSTDPSTPPQDAMSPALQARIDREKEKARRDNIKDKEAELKTTKTKMDYQKRETDQMKRFDKPQLEKDIQRLKGAKI